MAVAFIPLGIYSVGDSESLPGKITGWPRVSGADPAEIHVSIFITGNSLMR